MISRNSRLPAYDGRLRQRLTGDSVWIGAERLVSSALNILSILAIARLIGVTAYGHYAFAISVLGVALAFGHLGLDGLLIKRLIEAPEKAAEILGSVLAAKLVVYVPFFLLALQPSLVMPLDPVGSATIQALAPCFLLLPLSSTMIAWLNAKSYFSKASLARICAIGLGTGLKIGLIFAGFEVSSVALAHSTIFFIEALLLGFLVARIGGVLPHRWRFDFATLRDLLGEGLPLFLASLFAMMYMNVDVLALRFLESVRVVGEYALVPQIVQATQIVPYAITLAAFPSLVALLSEQGGREFFDRCGSIGVRLFVLGLIVAGLTAFLAPAIIPFLFGDSYQITVGFLQVAAIGLPFLFLRQLTTKMFICLKRGRSLVLIELAGLVFATTMNLQLIPVFGALGSAIALAANYALTTIFALAVLWLAALRQGRAET